jgi:uncharacterized membrane protein YdbT with pleckstrin-like domain
MNASDEEENNSKFPYALFITGILIITVVVIFIILTRYKVVDFADSKYEIKDDSLSRNISTRQRLLSNPSGP